MPSARTARPKPGAETGADADGFKDNHLVGTRDKNVGTKDTHINFGEFLDERDWDEAENHCSKADLCIVMGTSMSLRHITHFPFQAKETVIVNLQATPDDKKCKLRIWAQCDPVSAGLLARLGLEPMPVPAWRPRDALPLSQIPNSVSQPYREAADRLMKLAAKREEEDRAMAKVADDASKLSIRDGSEAAKCTVLIGNRHKSLPDGKHSWCLYVAGDGAKSLSSVEVWLHPTFQQNHFKLEAAPFELPCTGWGTFDIRLRLHTKTGEQAETTWPLQFDKDDANARLEI